jgi:TonB-linked SusC/RagA family outer membrane protein
MIAYKSKKFALKWAFSCCAIFICLTSMGQATFKGKVTDSDGSPISNASVQLEPSTYGATTDAGGNYSFTANVKQGKYTLNISSLGYKTVEKSISVTSATENFDNDIQLKKDINSMDQVIVTGTSAGTTKKQLGSYVSTIKAEDLNKGAASNVLQALQGKTAGAQVSQNSGDPAGGLSVRLRGTSSINSGSDPLYIIDGVIMSNATNRVTNTASAYDGNNFIGTVGQSRMVDINPADIERIEVLNGAAAAAIYGSRANAGVVQIFTKRGSSGAPVVSFSTSLMFSKLRKSVPVNQSPTKFGGPTDGSTALTQDVIALPLATSSSSVNRYDYNDYIFRNATGTDNNLSVSGGKDKTKYFASISYFNNQGIIKNTDFKRYSVRLNLDQAITNKLSMSAGLNYINSSGNEKPDGNTFFSPLNSINIIGNFHDLQTRDISNNIKAIGERGRVNPVSIIEDIKQRQETNRLIANVSLKYKPINGLTFDYTIGIDQYGQDGNTYIPPFAYNVSTGFFGGGPRLDPALNGYASKAANNFFQINNELNGTYTKSINSNITSVTQVGYSLQYEKNNYQLVQGRGLVPLVTTVTGFATVINPIDDRSEFSVNGLYLQQNFKIKNKLFLTGAIRRDGSTVFASNNRNQIYKKFSAGYVLSDNDWWTNSSIAKFWDFAKLRVSYGESGNLTGIGAYSRFNSYSPAPLVTKATLSSSFGLANTDMKPERQNEIEFGADFSFLKNKLNVTANIYSKKVTDLLFNRFVAPTTGYSSLLNNFGGLTNKGFELVINATVINKKDFKLEISEVFNRNRNKVTGIGAGVVSFATNSGTPIALIEGQPAGIFYGTLFARDNNGNIVKNNANGFLTQERGVQNSPTVFTPGRDPVTGLPTGSVVRNIIGDPNPDFTGSTILDASYKKLSLRMQFDYVQGGEVFNADWRTRQGVGNGKEAEKEQRGEYPRGYINSIYAIEEWRIDDGSFVKLRELALSYSLGKIKGFSNLSFSIIGRNLKSWDKYKGYDPEVNAGGQSTLLRGIDFGAIPIPRTISFTISAKF